MIRFYLFLNSEYPILLHDLLHFSINFSSRLLRPVVDIVGRKTLQRQLLARSCRSAFMPGRQRRRGITNWKQNSVINSKHINMYTEPIASKGSDAQDNMCQY
jgi:hypothetical protein